MQFYLQGLSKTSKTFLYKAFCYYYYSLSCNVLCIILTRITALLLLNKQIAYLCFKILIQLYKSITCNVIMSSLVASKL